MTEAEQRAALAQAAAWQKEASRLQALAHALRQKVKRARRAAGRP